MVIRVVAKSMVLEEDGVTKVTDWNRNWGPGADGADTRGTAESAAGTEGSARPEIEGQG